MQAERLTHGLEPGSPSVSERRPAAARRRRRAVLIAILASLALALPIAWWARRLTLAAAARILVSEDVPTRADVIVVSYASAKAGALEAARLFGDGLAPRVVIAEWASDPMDEEVRRLGAPVMGPTEVLTTVLKYAG